MISSDGETLFFAKSGTIPPSVKIIKRNAALHFSDSELVLRGIDTIEKEAIGLSKVKKLALIDVCSIENGAFVDVTSLEELAISCSKPISLDAPFVGFPMNGIKSVSLSCLNAPSVSALFGKSPLEISKLELKDMQLSPGFFEGVTLRSLYGKGLSGTSSVPNAASLEIEDSAPLSSLFAGSIKAESVLIKTQDIKRGDLGGIRAKTIWLKVSGVIEKGALDELAVEEKLILDGVTYIEEGALSHLVFRDLEILNSPYHAENGLVWKDGELFYFRVNGRTAVLPFGLTHVLPGSIDLSNAEILTIQDPKTHIEKGAFQYASRLKKIVACKTVFCEKLIDLFDNADAVEFIDFRGDTVPEKFLSGFPSLRTICLSPSVKTISDFALSRNPKLEKVIHFERASIYGDCVLMGCKSLSEIEFSPSAQLIGFGCFKDCVSLMRVSFPIPPNHVLGQASCSDMIGDNKDVEIVINGGNIPARYFKDIQNHISVHFSIKEIGEEAFLNCPYVSADLSFVETIGDRAFKNSGLRDCDLSSCKRIGKEAFANCLDLAKITLSTELEEFSPDAFLGDEIVSISMEGKGKAYRVIKDALCKGEVLVYVASGSKASTFDAKEVGVHEILPLAFSQCKNLVSIQGEGLKRIAARSFVSCPALESIDFSQFGCIIEPGAFVNCERIQELRIDSVSGSGLETLADLFVDDKEGKTIPKSLESLTILGSISPKDLRFENHLRSIVLSNGTSEIPNGYFSSCRELESFVAPNSCVKIGNSAFKGCGMLGRFKGDSVESYGEGCFEDSSLTEFTFGKKTKSIGNGMFRGCKALKTIIVEAEIPDFSLLRLGLSPITSNVERVELPSSENLGVEAFEGFSTLQSVGVPGGFGDVPDRCFRGCKNLRSIAFGDNCKRIGAGAFANSGVSEIALPSSLVAIGEEAFASTSIEVLSIPNGVTQLEKGAFRACKVSHLDYAAKDAFSVANLGIDPDSLLSARVKDAVLEEGAFADCHHLKNVVLDGEKYSRIPDRSFENCTSLTGVKVTINVTSVGKRAFANCSSLSLETSFFERIVEIEEEAFLASRLPDRIIIPCINNLGMRAFAKVKGLFWIEIGEDLKTIPTECFQGSSLFNIDLPKGLVSIENAAFASTLIEKIAIPSGVNNVGSTIFNGNHASVRVFTLADVSQWSKDWDEGLANFLLLFKRKVKVIRKERRW